mmetsp:Transcript_32900/g.79284  ORF Transcript_32900/g.79284 Transcript_32900/m.79284 type:complete len:149 (-) Transcript_32900:26-472(-)
MTRLSIFLSAALLATASVFRRETNLQKEKQMPYTLPPIPQPGALPPAMAAMMATQGAYQLQAQAGAQAPAPAPMTTPSPTLSPAELANLHQNLDEWARRLSDMATEVVVSSVKDFVGTVARKKAEEEVNLVFQRLYPNQVTTPAPPGR